MNRTDIAAKLKAKEKLTNDEFMELLATETDESESLELRLLASKTLWEQAETKMAGIKRLVDIHHKRYLELSSKIATENAAASMVKKIESMSEDDIDALLKVMQDKLERKQNG